MKILFALLFCVMSLTLQAEIKICAHCGKGSRYMRYSAENRHFCSEKCAKAKFSCSNCRNIPKGRYMIIMGINGESRRFCSACSTFKKCFSCFFPSARGRSFSDGRFQCVKCSREAAGPEKTAALLRQIRYDLAEMYGYDPRHHISLRLVSKNALKKITNDNNAMGCMKVQVTTYSNHSRWKKKEEKKWQCNLYLLDNLPPIAAAKVIAHELTHDHIYHQAGRGSNPKITEGICEAVSGEWLEVRGLHGYVEALKKNPDPVYGAGFREIFPQLKRYGMKGVLERYRSFFTPF